MRLTLDVQRKFDIRQCPDDFADGSVASLLAVMLARVLFIIMNLHGLEAPTIPIRACPSGLETLLCL